MTFPGTDLFALSSRVTPSGPPTDHQETRHLQGSRRPDSNRGPLHYERSACTGLEPETAAQDHILAGQQDVLVCGSGFQVVPVWFPRTSIKVPRRGCNHPGLDTRRCLPVLAQSTRTDLRNCVLVQPTGLTHSRVRLPLVRLPYGWLDERRPACIPDRKPGNAGKTYPATPVYGRDADLILDALYDPDVHAVGKWATKWGPIWHRNRTIMAVARGTGMRIHELLLLRPDDVDFETNQVVVRRGKGGKRRLIAILPDALAELEGWMLTRERLGFTRADLFFPVIEGPSRGGPVSQGYIRKRLHVAAREAGVSVRAVPHQWRHGLACELHRRKAPIGIIQRQLGHSSPATTGIYLAGISADEVIESVLEAFA